MAAVHTARETVARDWQSSFENPGTQTPGRQRRKRVFKSVAEVMSKTRALKLQSQAAQGKLGVKKTIAKQTAKIPTKKLLLPNAKEIEYKESNFTRSQIGYRLIRQRMVALLEMDKVAHPTRPMFDTDSMKCRLNMQNFDLNDQMMFMQAFHMNRDSFARFF